jgi:hypothetical protein
MLIEPLLLLFFLSSYLSPFFFKAYAVYNTPSNKDDTLPNRRTRNALWAKR